MSRDPFIVAPSRKPAFWAEIDRLNRSASKAAKTAVTEEIDESHATRVKRRSTSAKPAAKPPAKKTAKPSRAKGGTTKTRK